MVYNNKIHGFISSHLDDLGQRPCKFGNYLSVDFDEIVKNSTATVTTPQEDFLQNQYTQYGSIRNKTFFKIVS